MIRKILWLTGVMLLVAASPVEGQDDALRPEQDGNTPANGESGRRSSQIDWMRSLAGDRVTSLSDAELVALMRQAAEADRQSLERLENELDSPDSFYHRAEDAFNEAEDHWRDLQEQLANAENAGDEGEVSKLEEVVATREAIRTLYRERFDLAIERQKLLRQMIPALTARVAQLDTSLARTLGKEDTGADPATEGNTNEDEATLGEITGEQPVEDQASPAESAPRSEQFLAAEEEVNHWETVLAGMRQSLQLTDKLLSITDELLGLEVRFRDNTRLTLDNAEAARLLFSERFQDLSLAGASATELGTVQGSLKEASRLVRSSREQDRVAADRVESLNIQRGYVLEAHATRTKDVELAETNLEYARQQVTRISNPLHPQNVFRWLLDHGLNIAVILLGTVALYFVAHIIGSRIVRMVASRGSRGSKEERLSRANTLVYAFRQAATLTIVIGGILMVLDEAGVPIGPLLGGAAVLGLAVAFGAQNLIKDFFQGFMILLENQYKLNDVIQVGEHTGRVEKITLRTTVLRGQDGALHFIPNGQINAVSNMTHGWSRAVFELSVAYNEDVDRVIEVILDVCKEIRSDKKYRPLILDEVTMLGVDQLADSAVVIKFYLKTIPLQQWIVRREMLRRIKLRFDQEKIEIPYPHHALYLRSADGSPLENALSEAFANNGIDHDSK